MAKLCAAARLALGLITVAAATDEHACEADGGDQAALLARKTVTTPPQDGSARAPAALDQEEAVRTPAGRDFWAADRSIWVEQLKRSVSDGAKHRCKSDVVSSAFDRHIGLGNRIHTFAAQLLLAVYGGHSFSILNTSIGNDAMTRIWATHFENSAGFGFCDGHRSPREDSVVKLNWDILNGVSPPVDEEHLHDFKRFLYPFVWTVNSNTWNRVHAQLREAGLDMTLPYVGVHLRRGDKFTEASPVEIGVYADAIRPWLEPFSGRDKQGAEPEARKIEQVFLCSDDDIAAEELRTALDNRVRIVTPPPSDTKTRSYDSEESILGVIAAVEGLRRAHVFVGTASSNIGRLVFFLRPKGSNAISLDEGFNK